MDDFPKPLTVPVFAVLGHPNEGKSSVVSTLTEDDQIRVSRIPGETTESTPYTITIDGKDIIRFVDTPGFQVPKQALAWFRKFEGNPEHVVEAFIEVFKNDPFYADECELLKPVAKGAGIIYVVDGSRPVRDDDLAEMEILRLTGRPRMAVVNSKTDEKDYTTDWRNQFRKHFNSIRIFNSNTANFMERIKMLESLKAIDQEWEQSLSDVITAFQKDRQRRNDLACVAICRAIEQSLLFSLSESVTAESDPNAIKEKLNQKYQAQIKAFEAQMFKKIRSLFKHHLFEYLLPEYSILNHDLFSKQTWELLGLTTEQLVAAGAIVGGTVGAMIDTAAAGHTFGIFTAIGGVLGAGSALLSGKKMAKNRPGGIRLGGDNLQLGPTRNLQFLYILMDRALIYYSHIINRPHGRRDMMDGQEKKPGPKKGFSTEFTSGQRTICSKYFKTVTGRSFIRDKKAVSDFEEFIKAVLDDLSGK
jgi:GTP-binding protein EngB required for normal cell division